jgi:hypothetical protein
MTNGGHMHADENQGEHLTASSPLNPEWAPRNEWIPLFRGSARVIGGIVAGLSLLMLFGETLFSPPSPDGFPILPVALFGGYGVGMFLAFKWERAGATVAGVSAALLFVAIWLSKARSQNQDPPGFAVILGLIFGLAYFLPIILYMLCWRLEDRDRKRWMAEL